MPKFTQELGSSDTVKAVLTSSLTGGLLNSQFITVGGKLQSLNQLAGLQTLTGIGSVGSFNWNNLGQTLVGLGGRSLVTAGVNTVINGTDFGDTFRFSLVSDLSAQGANFIGNQWGSGVSVQPPHL